MTVTKSHFAFRIDRWDNNGNAVIEHVAWIEDLDVALAAFRAACLRWPGEGFAVREREPPLYPECSASTAAAHAPRAATQPSRRAA
jgi:hypothetical protein